MFSQQGLIMDKIPYDDLKAFLGRGAMLAVREAPVATDKNEDNLQMVAWARSTEDAYGRDRFLMVAEFYDRSATAPASASPSAGMRKSC